MDAINLAAVIPAHAPGADAGGQTAVGSTGSAGAGGQTAVASTGNTGAAAESPFGVILAQLGAETEPASSDQTAKDDPNAIVLSSLQTAQVSQISIVLQPTTGAVVPAGDGQATGAAAPINGQAPAFVQSALKNAATPLPPSGAVPAVSTLPVSPAPAENMGLEVKPAMPQTSRQAPGQKEAAPALITEKTSEPIESPSTPVPPAVKSFQGTGDEPASVAQEGVSTNHQPGLLESAAETVRSSGEPKTSGETRPVQPLRMAGPNQDNAALPESATVANGVIQERAGAAQNSGAEIIDQAGHELVSQASSTQAADKAKGSSKESKAPPTQDPSGAERFLTDTTQSPAIAAKAASSPQAPSQAATLPPEPAMPHPLPSIQVQVHQPDLGQVQVRVSMADQTVHANITTEHATVRDFLVTNQGRLEAGFSASGLQLGDFKVMVDAQGRNSYGQANDAWSYGAGQNAYGQGRGTQEQQGPFAQGPDHPVENAEGYPVAAWESRGLSLFA